MTGPLNPKDFNTTDYIGCKLFSWKSTSCYQRPGEKIKCTSADSGPMYDCHGINPGYLQWDLDGDLDVDLRDYAILMNAGK